MLVRGLHQIKRIGCLLPGAAGPRPSDGTPARSCDRDDAHGRRLVSDGRRL